MAPFRQLLALLALAATCAATPVFADWRSFLHGDPPAQPKAPAPKQLAVVTHEAAPDAQVEAFVRALAVAIKARDGKPMLARLSDRYSIDALDGRASAPDLFVQAVGQIAGPTP